MNKLTLDNQRDFILSTNALAFMQEAYALLEKMAVFGGDNYILSGCSENGSQIYPGYMVLGGMLVYCPVQTIQSTLYVKETVNAVSKNNGSREEKTYEVVFGTPTSEPATGQAYDWADVKENRITDVISLKNLLDTHTHAPVAIANADLDDYKTPGFFYCESDANAATVSNLPTAVAGGAFTLMVEQAATAKQTLTNVAHSSRTFMRQYHSWDTSWGDWIEVYTTATPPGETLDLTVEELEGNGSLTVSYARLTSVNGVHQLQCKFDLDVGSTSYPKFTFKHNGSSVALSDIIGGLKIPIWDSQNGYYWGMVYGRTPLIIQTDIEISSGGTITVIINTVL